MTDTVTGNRFAYLFAVCGIILCISGCSRDISSSSYDEASVGETRDAYPCVVVKVRRVKVVMNMKEGRVGIGAGALTGGSLGHVLAHGQQGQGFAMMAGGLVGALAGAALEKGLTDQDGLEYTVRLLRTGDMKVVVQGFDSPLHAGQRALLVVGSNGRSRVVRDDSFIGI
ncbi:MAG: hypothetical protein LBT90_00265 [Holosporaceae bacterium]|jgi:outer membrane lipoprotein SlyB|nr:hypothetical protein [Holosporaceae bacterium]